MAYKIWLFLWYFVLASFCGWVAEVGYIGMVYRKFKNPGMLNGPYCPQYGLMIALPWAALTALHWQTSFVATLFFCLISSFLVEFTFAWLLRKTTHIRLRDYSKFKWNIKGYVSVPVATVRGVCFSFIVVFIVPVLTSLLHYVNRTVGWVILYAVLGIMLLDIIITSITVQRLNHQFKRLSELGDRVREARNALGNAVTGGAIGAAEAIDDLDLQKKLQEAQRKANGAVEYPVVEKKPEITFEDFEKIQIQVGEVLKCEPVKKAKKLLCSQIRVGDEVRQIVSGISQYYKPEEMVGKKVAVVTNLAPRKICGVESQGMILAAMDDKDNLSVMTLDKDIVAGSEIG